MSADKRAADSTSHAAVPWRRISFANQVKAKERKEKERKEAMSKGGDEEYGALLVGRGADDQGSTVVCGAACGARGV